MPRPGLRAWPVLGLVGLVWLTYAGSLDNGFHYDDMHSIVENPHIRSVRNVPQFFVDPGMFSGEARMRMYRPLLLVTYALDYALHGYDPRGYRLVSITLHCLVVLCVFALLRRRASLWLAWWGTALFAVHPIHTQAVNYISSRSELLAALGVVTAVYLYGRGGRGRQWALVAQAAGLLCKSTAVVIAPMLLLPGTEDRWRRWGRQWPFWGITVVYLGIISVNGFLHASLTQDVRPYATQLSAQIKALALYLKLLVVPLGLSVEHQFHADSLSWAGAWWVSGLLAVSILALGLWHGNALVRWGIGWYVLCSALTFAIPLNVVVSEHRLYLPSVGIVFVLVGLLSDSRPARAVRVAGFCLLVPLAVLTWQRCRVWRDELSLWRDAAVQAPTMFRAQSNWGLALYNSGKLPQAEAVLERALRLNPEYARTWNNLGLVREELGALGAAERAFRRALGLDSLLISARVNLGHLLLRLGRGAEALALLQRTVEQAPQFMPAWTQLGVALQRSGDLDGARRAYGRAIALDARAVDAWNDLGLLELAEEAPEAAQRSLERALAVDPQHAEARLNLRGVILRRQGVPRLEACRQLAREFPEEATVWVALARAEADVGDWDRAVSALERAVALAPDPEFRLQLGGALRHAGKLARAIAVYEEALRTAPGSVRLRNALTSAYAAAGRRRDALASCRQTLSQDPENEVAKRHLRRLQGTAPSRADSLTPR